MDDQQQYTELVASGIAKLSEPIFGLNREGLFVYTNSKGLVHLGYKRAELFKKHLWEIDPSCSKELYEGNWTNKNESITRDSSTHITRDGRKVPVSIFRVYEKNENTELCILHVRDTSQLEAQRNLLSHVINELPSPFLIKNYEGKFIMVNEALAKLYDAESPESMLGKDDGDYIPDAKQAEFFKHNIQGIIDKGETQTIYEDSFNAKTGERRHYVSIKRPFVNHLGEKNIVVIANDITEMKKVGQRLLEYEKIISVSQDYLSFVDVDGTYKAVNDSYLKTFNISREDIIGKNYKDFIGKELYDNHSKPAFQRALGGEPSGYKTWYDSPDKGKRFIEANYYPYRQENSDEVTGVVIQIKDSTDKKKIEERLQRSERMEVIGQVAGGVAHDLNNILSGIVSYPELLLMQLPAEHPMRTPLETIQKTGNKAAAIVEDMLTLSRRGVKTFEVIRLKEVIDEYLESPEYLALLERNPAITLEKVIPKDLLHIMGSPVHITKTIMNLVTNAAEAMPEGGHLNITAENKYIDLETVGFEQVPENEYVALQITDTGIGMSQEEQGKVFEPFYTKKVMGRSGTGLGMAVVWGTIKDHKGFVDLKSKPGKGTTLTLLIPATRDQYHPPQQPDIVKFMGNGEKVLVVDDVGVQREIATAMLRQLGYDTSAVASGELALRWLQNRRADLVLLDMIMDPGMNGLDTYLHIKKAIPTQRVVITSGYSETANLNKVMQAGVKRFIKKPYSMLNMAMAIREALEPS